MGTNDNLIRFAVNYASRELAARGAVGSDSAARDMVAVPPRSRRRCSCCRRKATHYGRGGGVVLTMGCEWLVRQWVRDPAAARRLVVRRRSG